jgi:hypothetical protein
VLCRSHSRREVEVRFPSNSNIWNFKNKSAKQNCYMLRWCSWDILSCFGVWHPSSIPDKANTFVSLSQWQSGLWLPLISVGSLRRYYKLCDRIYEISLPVKLWIADVWLLGSNTTITVSPVTLLTI